MTHSPDTDRAYAHAFLAFRIIEVHSWRERYGASGKGPRLLLGDPEEHMRAIRVASAALLGLTALALSAPVAHAVRRDNSVTSFGFSVVPSTVAAGGEVTLRVDNCNCTTPGCPPVSSTRSPSPGVSSSATAKVDWDAKPGATYRVTFTCGGESGHTDLSIAIGRPSEPTQYPLPIQRGVHAGEGGSVAGFDLKEIGMGAALIAGALTVAYHFSRRRAGDDNA